MTDNIRTNFCPGCKTLADDLEAMTHARNDALALAETFEAELIEQCRITAAHKETAEAKLWFEKAQEWKQENAALKARVEALEGALRTIQGEAERENGNWTHLKRCIGAHAHQALKGTPHAE